MASATEIQKWAQDLSESLARARREERDKCIAAVIRADIPHEAQQIACKAILRLEPQDAHRR